MPLPILTYQQLKLSTTLTATSRLGTPPLKIICHFDRHFPFWYTCTTTQNCLPLWLPLTQQQWKLCATLDRHFPFWHTTTQNCLPLWLPLTILTHHHSKLPATVTAAYHFNTVAIKIICHSDHHFPFWHTTTQNCLPLWLPLTILTQQQLKLCATFDCHFPFWHASN